LLHLYTHQHTQNNIRINKMIKTITHSCFKHDKHNNIILTNNKKSTFICFTTNSCQACKIVEPMLEQLAKKYKRSLPFVKFDTGALSNVPLISEMEIYEIPTLIIIDKKGHQFRFDAPNLAFTLSNLDDFIIEHLPRNKRK
jgi:thiol-disulfide isomerase/thioredoxin